MNGDELFFLDTNVLLYATDSPRSGKEPIARRWLSLLWTSGAGRVSWQVLHEFYANAVRKFRRPLPIAREIVEDLATWQPVDTSLALVRRAWHWTDAARISYWDALIVAAAELAGCTFLLTEDLQAGRKFGDVLVVDPFQSDPVDFGLETRSRPS
jgi:predicted nucleic acid-binding protein